MHSIIKCKNCNGLSLLKAKCEVCNIEGCVDCFEITFISKGSIPTGGDIDMDLCQECYVKFDRNWIAEGTHCRHVDDVLALKNYIRSIISSVAIKGEGDKHV